MIGSVLASAVLTLDRAMWLPRMPTSMPSQAFAWNVGIKESQLPFLTSIAGAETGLEKIRDQASHPHLRAKPHDNFHVFLSSSILIGMTSQTSIAVASALFLSALVWLVSFVSKWRKQRARYQDLPCPPHHWFWGHLKVVGEAQREMPPGCKSVTLIMT
jgi:hypothetical protein